MSNPRKKIIYDSTLTNPWEIDANNNGPVVLYDASGDPILTAANPGVIEATDLDIRDLTSASDSVEVIQDTAADLNATVVATDLDIRALDPAIDEVVVQATDLDIRDLTKASDSISVYDSAGNVISSTTNPNTGSQELLINAEGHECTDNSTTTPLGIDGVFTGASFQDMRDYGVLTVNIATDEDSATDGLDVQWSDDGVNVRDHDYMTVYADTPKTFTFGPAQRYYRIVYTNGGTAQTSFNLFSIIRRCYVKPSSHRITSPIVGEDDAELVKAVLTGIDPDNEFINIEAGYSGSLNVDIVDGETGARAEVEPLGALKTESPVRLVGTTFSNGTKDPNFWTETVTGTGSVTQAGQIVMATGTTANSTAKYVTVRKARKITGTTNQFRCIAGLTTDAQANNIRRIGAYSTTDGFFFQANGTTMQVASRKASSDTTVSSGSFNGNYGANWSPSTNALYRLVIEYTAFSARFFVNGKLLHTIENTTSGISNTLTLPCTMENINSGGNTTNNTFVVQFCTILRLGELITNGKYYYAGTVATTILKYGAGVLQRVTVTDNTGDMLIYDGLSAAGTVIANLDASKTVGTMEFNAPFSDGLTIVTTGPPKMTVIYE